MQVRRAGLRRAINERHDQWRALWRGGLTVTGNDSKQLYQANPKKESTGSWARLGAALCILQGPIVPDMSGP